MRAEVSLKVPSLSNIMPTTWRFVKSFDAEIIIEVANTGRSYKVAIYLVQVVLISTMKCTPMKLLSRSEYFEWKTDEEKSIEPLYFSKESSGFSYSFMKDLLHDKKKSPILSVKNLELPDHLQTYNLGQSLEKWSKKRPRLKSGHKEQNVVCHRFEERDDKACDITEILSNLENNKEDSKGDSSEYEVNSDIEELWERSQGSENCESAVYHQSPRLRDHAASKKKIKNKLKKTIRFSFSKPPSPQTEQVIRVDVSSSISLAELKLMEIDKGNCKRGHINCKKHYQQNFRKDEGMEFENEEQILVLRCSQLALTPKKLMLS